ncbi:hypothetical protein RvY_12020 [Ramazzottius varieornatus]|uniref:Chromo domain-containing protein n=1 Tax=Ramazzottius varieornatus TaxID=947166 RepID=A0A1D1VMC3_RAMVA|nr:hypothetical protein RvY_12020 [Ramazzottius varieornatus]
MRPLDFVVPVKERQLPRISLPPPPLLVVPVEDQGPLEYEVDGIIADRTENGVKQFLVKWKNYGPEENSWQIADLYNSVETVDRYLRNIRKAKLQTKHNRLCDMFTYAHSPASNPPPTSFTAPVHAAVETATKEIPLKPTGSLTHAIRAMVEEDAESFVYSDVLYERLAVSFFKEKNYAELSLSDQKSIQNSVKYAMVKAYPEVGKRKSERRGGRRDRRPVYNGLRFI